jgi:HPt (histidine-containing phosphotransfer) domain-containing protein
MNPDPMECSANQAHEIRSTLADDPEFKPILEMFIAGLEGRIERLEQCLKEKSWTDLAKACHQAAGVAKGYGFPQISDVAKQCEIAIVKEENTVKALPLANELRTLFQAAIDGFK